jgi:CDP-6-deoxy-D-xylo-4-hexulose-3-dehydrase
MGKQPFYTERFGRKELPNANTIDEFGFYVPNHPDLTQEEIEFICNIIKKHTK